MFTIICPHESIPDSEWIKLFVEELRSLGIENLVELSTIVWLEPCEMNTSRILLAATKGPIFTIGIESSDFMADLNLHAKLSQHANLSIERVSDEFLARALEVKERSRSQWEPDLEYYRSDYSCADNCGSSVSAKGKLCQRCSRKRANRANYKHRKWKK